MAAQFKTLMKKWSADGPVRIDRGNLELGLDDGTTVPIEINELSEGEVELSATWQVPKWLGSMSSSLIPNMDDLAKATEQQRSGLLRCSSSGNAIEVKMTLYTDGLSRQTFIEGVTEVGRAYSAFETMASTLEAQKDTFATAERELADAKATSEAAEQRMQQAMQPPASPDGSGTAVRPPSMPPEQAIARPPSAPPQPAATAWRPTHTVPPSGLQAWTSPDPSQPAVATLAAGTQLQVKEMRGAWAHVSASNGWTGWVDGRILQQVP